MKIEDAIEQIADHYGLQNQIQQCSEECGEMIVALSKLRRSMFGNERHIGISGSIYDIAEEMADISIMLCQIQYLLNIPDEQIMEIIEEKLKRELDRIQAQQRCMF